MADTPATPEEQLQEVAAAYNMLVRKNRALLTRIASAEDEKADLQARAETQIEALQRALQEAQGGDKVDNAPAPQPEVFTPDEVINSTLPS